MVLSEGGNIFKDPETKVPVTQRINRDDVDPTLTWLEKITNIPHVDNKLGSTGRKDTSGDLDIAIDQKAVSKEELVKKLVAWVKANHPDDDPKQWVKKSGISVHFKTPIGGDETNGFVQTDLMFGDPEWMKWSLQGATGESPFKGVHRQILIASIAKSNGYKWSANKGLIDRDTNDLISTNPSEIAQKLLGPTAQADDLESVETIITKARTLPNYDELVADAKETFAKDNLELPEDQDIDRLRELAGL